MAKSREAPERLQRGGSLRNFVQRFRDSIPCLVVWLPAVVAALYVKKTVLDQGIFVRLIGGLRGQATFAIFSGLQELTFFRADLLASFAVIPFLLLLAAAFLERRARAWFVAACSLVAILVLYVQLQAFLNVGRFLSLYLLIDAARWGLRHHEYIGEYMSASGVAKAAVLGLAVVLLAAWTNRREGRRDHMVGRQMRSTVVFLCAVVLVVTLVSWWPFMKSTWYHRNVYGRVLAATLAMPRFHAFVAHGDVGALSRQYREIAGGAPPSPEGDYWGRTSGYDVVFFVLETAPARYLAFDGDLSDLPALRRLRATSWVGTEHYTTYPWTSRATFSILTSMYPPDSFKRYYAGGGGRATPGLIRALTGMEYAAGLYMPFEYEDKSEERMYASLGFDRILISYPKRGLQRDQEHLDQAIELDKTALNRLCSDIHKWHAAARHFVAVYCPQIGHAPWRDVVRDGTVRTRAVRARDLAVLQDRWLGIILDQLDAEGRSGRTIVVVVGDHGIRTRTEDPEFRAAGRLDDYSYRVPLLIYAPGGLASRVDVPWVTSHIDITPTVLSLMGVQRGRDFEQGSPVWDRSLTKRTTFLFGNDYFGSEGFYANNAFSMWNRVTDEALSSEEFHFDDGRILGRGSAGFVRVTAEVTRIDELQDAWLSAAIR